MEYTVIQVEREGRVGIIRLNRPEALNAFNNRMSAEWVHALDAFNDDDGIGAVVFTGNGRGFCAGGDIGGFARQLSGEAPPEPEIQLTHSAWDCEYLATSKPLIAAVNGIAIGGGLTSILWFDRIIASTEARFSMRFVKLGLTPELNSQWLLPRIIGLHNAKEMMLTGRIYSAAEAMKLGLVQDVVEPDRLMPAAIALAAEIAENPLSSLRAIKRNIYQDMLDANVARIEERSTRLFAESRSTIAHREAIGALQERREPRFHDTQHMAALEARAKAAAGSNQAGTLG